MRTKLGLMMLSASLLVGCAEESRNLNTKVEPSKESAMMVPQAEVVAVKLLVPWSIQKSGATFYISERPGSLAEVTNGKLVRQPVIFTKKLSTAAEAGFLGLVLHPEFTKNQKVFAYYTYEESGRQFNRVVVIVKEAAGYRETDILLDRIPSGSYHHGGRIKIGPDGKLYVTTGDATVPESAQDPKSLSGKLLRLNLDGTIPTDNPFPNSPVFSYGHRNPQGLVWDSSGNLFESEHGQSAHDEINVIKAGVNYGWPIVTGDDQQAGMESPLLHSGDETWAPSGMGIAGNKLYVATLRGNAIREVDLTTQTSKVVISGFGRIRDVFVEGEALYFVSNNTDGRGNPDENDDKLYKVSIGELK